MVGGFPTENEKPAVISASPRLQLGHRPTLEGPDGPVLFSIRLMVDSVLAIPRSTSLADPLAIMMGILFVLRV